MKRTPSLTASAEVPHGQLETAAQLARRKAVCRRTVANWVREGKLHCIRLGKRCVRFDRAKADEEIARFTVEAEAH